MPYYNSVNPEIKAMLDKSEHSYKAMRDALKRKDIARDRARELKRKLQSVEV